MKITVETTIALPVEKVWEYWTLPEHIVGWNFASDDWHSPYAVNDLKPGGRLVWRMEARDGSMGFDFSGKYTIVENLKKLEYILDDGRIVNVAFNYDLNETTVVETFDTEDLNSVQLQKEGWQNILNNFKKYSEKI
jgi:uncharacterized protein YndB with AHSA1/START domain